MKYKKLNRFNDSSKITKILKENSKTILTVFISVSTTLIITKNIYPENKKNFRQLAPINHEMKSLNKNSYKPNTTEKVSVDTVILKNVPKVITKKNKVPKNQVSKVKIKTSKYNILRVDQLSEAFEQGKIYATIDEPYNTESLRKVCDKIFKDHSEYRNIIICLYVNNQIGISLALNEPNSFNEKQKSEAWLAMFTFNSVEGAFFNDRPSEYLGSY